MTTVFFYNFILLSSTFFVWLSEKMRYKLDRWFLLGIAFLLVFVPAAIRYDVGTDYMSYLAIYQDSWRLESYKKEPGFYFINWFYQSINAHFQWMFATFAFIFTAVAFKAYPRKQAWVLHLALITLLYFQSFNIVRQAVAMVFCLWALKELIDKQNIKFIALCLLASLFHQSAVIFLLVGLASLIPVSYRLKTYIAPVFFIVFLALSFLILPNILKFIEWALLTAGMTKFASYFGNSKHFIARELGTGMGVLITLSFCFYVFTQSRKLLNTKLGYWAVILFTFCYAFSVALSAQIVIFGRAVMTFLPGFIYVIYVMYSLPSNTRLKNVFVLMFLLFLIMSFFKESFGIPNHYYDPKRVPYQTIFGAENQ